MLPQEIIRQKRDKHTLSKQQINEFISGVVNSEIDNSQIAALTMAILLNGLNKQETIDLTLAMRDSGEVLHWDGFDKPIVDKHSSGGVGDKVSIMIVPILAACDVYVPMIAGRGLGHTGGTIDKLESIPGYNTQADNDLFRKAVKEVGGAIIGQTEKLAPADKKIYAVRDVCGTVESIPLITSSILSKKLAAGLQYLVMDLKCGNGAFMKDFESAKSLAESIVEVANGAGTKTSAILTDMNQVLGHAVGNALEIREAIEYLNGKNVNKRLDKITKTLCIELLQKCGRCQTEDEALQKIEQALNSGAALEKFAQMVSALGGPHDFSEHYNKYLPKSALIKPLYAEKSGFVTYMDTLAVGMSIIELKGGRTVSGQKLDLATGYEQFCQIGDFLDDNRPIALVHCQSEEQFDAVKHRLLKAIHVSEKEPELQNPIILKVS